ncbi:MULTISPECIES: hypothetical protein [Vibrio]|uniref:Uncharacterized protein n=1 Tax=Vibrio splendidus TaxID=29497 RepID=A0A2N7JXF7_VIBSP|nr:hypothetical protein [Vibrio splendidus]PMM64848.1 hypothetical protein BCT54_17290 [Vibrio splendidus]
MSIEYRKGKKQIYGCYLTDEDYETVTQAIEKAAKNIGVTNNRKARMVLLEMARFYHEKGTSE